MNIIRLSNPNRFFICLDFLNSYSRAPATEYRKQVLLVVAACLESGNTRCVTSEILSFISPWKVLALLVNLIYPLLCSFIVLFWRGLECASHSFAILQIIEFLGDV
jgi:hypothetical protein